VGKRIGEGVEAGIAFAQGVPRRNEVGFQVIVEDGCLPRAFKYGEFGS